MIFVLLLVMAIVQVCDDYYDDDDHDGDDHGGVGDEFCVYIHDL